MKSTIEDQTSIIDVVKGNAKVAIDNSEDTRIRLGAVEKLFVEAPSSDSAHRRKEIRCSHRFQIRCRQYLRRNEREAVGFPSQLASSLTSSTSRSPCNVTWNPRIRPTIQERCPFTCTALEIGQAPKRRAIHLIRDHRRDFDATTPPGALLWPSSAAILRRGYAQKICACLSPSRALVEVRIGTR